MSSAAALTIIAISVGFLSLLAIVAIIFLLVLVTRLLAFQKTLVKELGELRALVTEVRETTDRVGHTVKNVQVTAQRVASVAGAVATIFAGRRAKKAATIKKSRAWWVAGASLGWSLLKKRRQKAQQKKPRALPTSTDGSASM